MKSAWDALLAEVSIREVVAFVETNKSVLDKVAEGHPALAPADDEWDSSAWLAVQRAACEPRKQPCGWLHADLDCCEDCWNIARRLTVIYPPLPHAYVVTSVAGRTVVDTSEAVGMDRG